MASLFFCVLLRITAHNYPNAENNCAMLVFLWECTLLSSTHNLSYLSSTGGITIHPTSTGHWANVGRMLGQRRRRWPNICQHRSSVLSQLVSGSYFLWNYCTRTYPGGLDMPCGGYDLWSTVWPTMKITFPPRKLHYGIMYGPSSIFSPRFLSTCEFYPLARHGGQTLSQSWYNISDAVLKLKQFFTNNRAASLIDLVADLNILRQAYEHMLNNVIDYLI